jgi:hypothetical protein
MSTDLTITPPATPIPSDAEARSIFQLATTLAESGLFKDTRQASQAFAKIMFGRDLGLGATQAMTGIDLIEGKPSMSANLQAALLRQYRSPEGERYDYRADVSAAGCRVTVLRINAAGEREEIGTTSFGPEEAKQAGLAGGKNYQKFGPNMYFARAISNAVAFFAPEVTYGVRTYSEGELTGELVEPSPLAPIDVVPTPADDREVVKSLETQVRAHGVTTGVLAEKLLANGAPPRQQPFTKWIAMCPDEVLAQTIASILSDAAQVVDAEVVPDDPEAAEFLAEQRRLDEQAAKS